MRLPLLQQLKGTPRSQMYQAQRVYRCPLLHRRSRWEEEREAAVVKAVMVMEKAEPLGLRCSSSLGGFVRLLQPRQSI